MKATLFTKLHHLVEISTLDSLFISVLALSQHYLLCLLFSMALKPILRFLLVSSSQLSISWPLSTQIPLLSISKPCIMTLGEVATCSIMDECIGPLKSLKRPFSVYTYKCFRTQEKTAKHYSSGLQKSLNPPYSPIGSACKLPSHIAMACVKTAKIM